MKNSIMIINNHIANIQNGGNENDSHKNGWFNKKI